MEPLILVVNSGSASRKYGLFEGKKELARFYIEKTEHNDTIGKLTKNGSLTSQPTIYNFKSLTESTRQLLTILVKEGCIKQIDDISAVGVRVVAPGARFLSDSEIDDSLKQELETVAKKAPLHIVSTLEEIEILKTSLSNKPFFAISDSSFHITKPDYAWNYAINLELADKHDIKRFGYHGISIASCLEQLSKEMPIPQKIVVCHLGGGASVSAIANGKSIDSTMGYSPLEGVMMATRSGSIDVIAVKQLEEAVSAEKSDVINLLNKKSGLLGISGSSSDIRKLLILEKEGDYRASLALKMYVNQVQKAIGAMTSALNGIDMLIFTGTVGQRSSEMRDRILKGLSYLSLEVSNFQNERCYDPPTPTPIHSLHQTRPIYVISADETREIALKTQNLIKN